jgi:hypothetical protein
MAAPKNLLSTSGGGAVFVPAFAGSGLYRGLFSAELPRPVITDSGTRNPCQEREVVRGRAGTAVTVTSDDRAELTD